MPTTNRSDHPVAPDQLPLAQLVIRRRWEMEAALAIYPESLARDRATVLLHQGACIIQDGDVGGGLAYATRVLDGLPVQHHTQGVYATGRAVMRVVPTQERGRPEVADLQARLALSPG